MNTVFHACYAIALSLWTGGITLFTFVITPVIFRSYGRDMAGKIVGKLFPGYFLYNLLISIAVFILYFTVRSMLTARGSRWSLVLIIAALIINVFVTFKLHPDIRKVKQEILSFETLSEDSPERRTFRRLHAVSAVLNLILLADGAVLILLSNGFRQ